MRLRPRRDGLLPRRRTVQRALVVALVLAAEAWTYQRYAVYGAQFHFWLHGLLGGWLGLAVLVGARLLRPGRRARAGPAESAFTGHLFSALPDVLFVTAGLLHASWMDVFGVHITLHVVPAPLLTVLLLWGLALAASGALLLERRQLAGGLLAGSVALLGGAVLLADPLPGTLAEVRQGVPQLQVSAQWWCGDVPVSGRP